MVEGHLPQSREERLKENLRQLGRNVVPPANHKPLLEPGEYGQEMFMRPKTRMHRYFVNFAFNESGLGDYLNYSSALIWLSKNSPWIDGRLFVSESFVQLFKHIFDIHRVRFEVMPGEEAGKFIEPGTPVIGPELKINGQNVNPQLLNPIGCHLIDLGFAYYANKCPAPEGVTLPHISFPQSKVPHKIRHLRGKYIVIPTGVMVPSRFVSGDHINPLVQFIKENGFTPVFIGKKNSVPNLTTVFADDINYGAGLDLRDQTDLLTAGAIMEGSAAVMGLDNGMLHLASCTNANVLFGYSIAGPDQRAPRRTWGKTYNMFLSSNDLACANCQSHLKLMLGHTFHKCFYGDNKCIDILFIDQVERWKIALTECFNLWEKNQCQNQSTQQSLPTETPSALTV